MQTAKSPSLGGQPQRSTAKGRSSPFAPRPFTVQAKQDPHRPPAREEIENEAFHQHKSEAFGLQLKAKQDTITPLEKERLGVLQAKAKDFWAQRMERAEAQPNLLEILLRNAQTTQTTESHAPVQSNTIQAKGNPTGDRHPSSQQVIQRVSYMRALTGDDRVAREVESLQHVFRDETNRQHQVNTWVDGFAGMPTARFTSAERHYYSPVGYKLETENDQDVLANYRGDGNTNDIPVTHPRWVTAAQQLRTAVLEVADYNNWAGDLDDDPWGPLPVVNAETGQQTRSDYVNYYLKPYLQSEDPEDPDAVQARNEGKAAVREAIKTSGIDVLRAHYGDPNSGVPDRHMGAGRNPEGMAEAVNNPDTPYIESILHAKFNQVTAAWYNKDLGDYADAAAQANWRSPNPDWLANRRTSAESVRDAFNHAGANIQIEEIGPEPQGQ